MRPNVRRNEANHAQEWEDNGLFAKSPPSYEQQGDRQMGYNRSRKSLPPRMVKEIFEYLGEP